MPARRNPKKKSSRTPAPTPPGTEPAAGRGPLPAVSTRSDLPALPVKSALPAIPVEPARPVGVPPAVEVPAAIDVPVVVDVPAALDVPPVVDASSVAGRSAAPKAGPPLPGAARSAGGKSQRAGQPRRYAFRRS
ncbi:hypothetical protein [Micromonospora sp. NPDC005161]